MLRVRSPERPGRGRRRRCPVLVWIAAGLLGATPAAGQSPYPAPIQLNSPGAPTRVAAGDFNSDGRLDLVVNAPEIRRVVVHVGLGALQFSSRISLNLDGAVSDLATADIDHDGVVDIVWVDATRGRVGVLYTRGSSPLSFEQAEVPGADEAAALALVDRDQDGWVDVVVAHRGADEVRWYRNDHGQLVADEIVQVGDGPARLQVVERQDGRRTLAVAQWGYLSRDTVLLDVDLSDPLAHLRQAIPGGVGTLDLDGDGWRELTVTDAGTGRVTILRDDAGVWTTVSSFDGEPGALVAREFDSASAENRVLVMENSRNRVRLWRDQDGGGAFVPGGAWFVGAGVEDMLVADLDDDGASEVTFAIPEADAVRVVEAVGEGLFAPRAELAPVLPLRVERDGPLATATRAAILGIGIAPEVWVYGVQSGTLVREAKLSAPAEPREITFADLDGQAPSDLLLLSPVSGVWRSLARVDGSFAPFELVVPIAGSSDFEVASLVGGAALDLAVADPSLPGLRVYQGDGSGGFTLHSSRTSEQVVFVVRARDLDLDGFTDLVTLGEVNELLFFYGSATGPGAGVRRTVGPTPRDLAFGRFNSDAFPDLVICSAGFSVLSVVTSSSGGIYSVVTTALETSYGAQNCEAFDVNGDGFDDVVVSSPTSSLMALHLATGSASLGVISPFPFTIRGTVTPIDHRALYVDGDAIADLLVLDHLAGAVAVLRSDPLQDLAPVQATLTARWEGDGVALEVFADAGQTNEIELIRAADSRPLALTSVEAGRWTARDPAPVGATPIYVVRDRRGHELDRVEVDASGSLTASGAPTVRASILPARWVDGRAELRFRLPGNPEPRVRVYDLRGRRVGELSSEAGDEGWFRAIWSARDGSGRSAARGRYLVRVEAGGHRLVTSVVVR